LPASGWFRNPLSSLKWHDFWLYVFGGEGLSGVFQLCWGTPGGFDPPLI